VSFSQPSMLSGSVASIPSVCISGSGPSSAARAPTAAGSPASVPRATRWGYRARSSGTCSRRNASSHTFPRRCSRSRLPAACSVDTSICPLSNLSMSYAAGYEFFTVPVNSVAVPRQPLRGLPPCECGGDGEYQRRISVSSRAGGTHTRPPRTARTAAWMRFSTCNFMRMLET
jgi:hypothetical protein